MNSRTQPNECLSVCPSVYLHMFVCVSVNKAMAVRSSSSSSTSAAAAAAAAADDDDDDDDDVMVELELDELNQHECMSSLICVLRHMQLNAITPTIEQVVIVCHLY